MRKGFKRLRICWAVLMAAGCAGTPRMHPFPAAWPTQMDPPVPSVPAVPSAPLDPGLTGPAVWVEPFVPDWDGEPIAEPAGSSRPTGEVLTLLFTDKLRAAGLAVSPEKAKYIFVAVVPQLGYTLQEGYPRKITYFSRMAYQLIRRETGNVIWDGDVTQEFQQTVLVNTMTRLPSDPDGPERVLLEKCVEPTWQAVASDLGAYLRKQRE